MKSNENMIPKINLYDLCSLSNNEELSEQYLRTKLNFEKSKKYRHSEIQSIKSLLSKCSLSKEDANDFIYSYSIPQLNREFDLLKISKDSVINIEIKGSYVSLEKRLKQLKTNRHFLNLLKKDILSFSYDSSDNSLFKFENDHLIESDFNELLTLLTKNKEIDDVDLDKTFCAQNILVSPLNDTERFLSGEYLLTENQENIKKKVLEIFKKDNESFVGICGNAGTGKTLLLYDIAKELSKNNDVTIIHCGKLCKGHITLNHNLEKLSIIEVKSMRYKQFLQTDVILVDESHRIYNSILEKIARWTKKSKTLCVFSYDKKQIMSLSEERRNSVNEIMTLCSNNIFELSNGIRTNKELNLFIQALLDLGKIEKGYKYQNVDLVYEPSKKSALERARLFEKDGYKHISYTPSFYNNKMDWQKTDSNTHAVIGQEFEKVVMILDDNFYYDGKKLKASEHPNPDYLFVQLLYQGLTRTRSKLALIVTDQKLLANILKIFCNDVDNNNQTE